MKIDKTIFHACFIKRYRKYKARTKKIKPCPPIMFGTVQRFVKQIYNISLRWNRTLSLFSGGNCYIQWPNGPLSNSSLNFLRKATMRRSLQQFLLRFRFVKVLYASLIYSLAPFPRAGKLWVEILKKRRIFWHSYA